MTANAPRWNRGPGFDADDVALEYGTRAKLEAWPISV
jgi:hypothetical protein